jgi:hypothetical protein
MRFSATGEISPDLAEHGLDAYLAHAGVPREAIE